MKRLPLRPDLLRAFLEGRKTVTRRLINPQPIIADGVHMEPRGAVFSSLMVDFTVRKPKYQPGDIVGIGEPWCLLKGWDKHSGNEVVQSVYADANELPAIYYLNDGEKPAGMGRTRTGRFLPDALVRHRARIVSVRAERLQEITEEELKAEGIDVIRDEWAGQCQDFDETLTDQQLFTILWDHLHGKEAPWSSDPWVFRYEIAPCTGLNPS